MPRRNKLPARNGWGRVVQVGLASGLFGWLLLPSPAHAEPCWMIGCRGQVGYVFVPLITPGKPHIVIDGKDCDIPTIPRPFGDGLPPDVNSVVAIAEENTPLLSEEAIVSHLGSFAGVSIQRDAVTGRCWAVWNSPRDVPSKVMKAGATIKILGYRTFVSEGSEIGSAGAITRHEQLLFALVLVQTDTR